MSIDFVSIDLLNLFILTIFGGVFRDSMHNIISSANSDCFTSSFAICTTFLSFPCLIYLTRTSNTVLNKVVSFLFLILEKTFSFLPLSMILAVSLSSVQFSSVQSLSRV